jgi:copper chaperone CopZ
VEEVLSKIKGVHTMEAELSTQQATITYDPSKVKPEQLAKALTDYRGSHDFTASVLH